MNKEIIDKILLASIGVMFMTRERAEEIFDDYLLKWEADKAVRGTMVEDLIRRSQEAHKDLEKLLADHINKIAKKLNLVNKQDLRRVEKKINKLLKSQGLEIEESNTGKAQDKTQKTERENTQKQEK